MNDFVKHIRKCNLSLADDVIITYDNVKNLGEFIGVSAIRKVMHFFGERAYNLYYGLVNDIIYKKQASQSFSDGYDIAAEAICFLCEHVGKQLGEVCVTDNYGKKLNIRDACFKTVFRYINNNQKHENNKADLEQPNLIEMSVPFENKLISDEQSTDIKKIMRKIGLNDKEILTLNLIMSGMTRHKVSKHFKMSNNAIYCRVNQAKKKYIKTFGVPSSVSSLEL